MKKAAFAALIIFTLYMAAMFHHFALLVLFASETLLFIIMFFLSRYLRRGLTLSFPEHSGFAEIGTEIQMPIHILNKGKLPINWFEANLQLVYRQDDQVTKHKLCAGGISGDRFFGVRFSPPLCGLIDAALTKMFVYDYLAIFSAKKRMAEKMEIAVFPRDNALCIELPTFDFNDNTPAEEHAIRHTGDSHNEIRQIREYRTGDSNRHIHWNQSAKTDVFWIKEYEKETDSLLEVFADLSGAGAAGFPRRSAFFELLSALVLGLLRRVATVRVYWADPTQKRIFHEDIQDISQCREMLLKLYRLDYSKAGEELPGIDLTGRYFSLDMNLQFFLDKALIYQFKEKKLSLTISKRRFEL
ncbi:MAG: DUF58 domain-containing protein [Clostridiales bacterium]|jgi:uncharacterized protein (DUF58 family)|nr:DUF58 domain-containing protein [Clostridiales bacterium]MDR2750296.1 DUF58 domain-containing protein [Clostridiales bacterium]